VDTEAETRTLLTDPGVVLGTVGYMSPEQVQGRPADHRSDIFSFGCVLYEMLTGRRAFRGATAVETMNAILKEEPPEVASVRAGVPRVLERVVCRCLEKKPEARFQTASDLAFAVEAFSDPTVISGRGAATLVSTPARPKWRARLPWVIVGLAVLLAALVFALSYFRLAPPAAAPEAVRLHISLPEGTRTTGSPAISPDGRHLVFRVNAPDDKELLWVRSLGSLDAQPLAGTEGGAEPFWSPDSRSVGFFAGGKFKRVDLSGGPAQTLCDAMSSFGGTWNRDGVIVFTGGQAGLQRIPASGGTPAPVTSVDTSRGEISHIWPYFLPDGRHFLFLARNAQHERSAIYVGSLDSKETKPLMNVHSSMAYAPPGYLLFVRGQTLMAQGFDAAGLELKGEPFPVAEQVGYNPRNGHAFFSVSENGVLGFRSAPLATIQLVWFDRTGKQLEAVTPPGSYRAPALSPDEKSVAVNRRDTMASVTSDVWLIDLARSAQTRFTFDRARDRSPVWSPDGSRIAFSSTQEQLTNLYQKPSSGAGVEEQLLSSGDPKIVNEWSPDGRFILFQQRSGKPSWDLMLLPLSGERKPEPLLHTDFDEFQGHFSPDGRWIAYVSNETGQYEIYVQSFPPSGGKWMVSSGGGSQPRWRGDGRELYYFAANRKLMAVEVNGESATFAAGQPQPLFQLRSGNFPGHGYYVAARDGKRFLVTSYTAGDEAQQITVVLNWTVGLKR
jgi:Tol biopolymer transport system component